MPKYRAKQSDIIKNEPIVIGFGYCSLQFLLYGQSPILYTSGVYGWKADFYRLPNGWLLSTGYCPINKYYNQAVKEKADKLRERLLKLNRKIEHSDKLRYNKEKINKLVNKALRDI